MIIIINPTVCSRGGEADSTQGERIWNLFKVRDFVKAYPAMKSMSFECWLRKLNQIASAVVARAFLGQKFVLARVLQLKKLPKL
jgi:hypothetical protein